MAPRPFGHTVLDLVHKQGCCTRSDSEVQLQAVLIILPFWYHFAQTTWQLLNEYFSSHGFSFHDFGKLEAQNEAAASAVGSLNPIFHFGVSICSFHSVSLLLFPLLVLSLESRRPLECLGLGIACALSQTEAWCRGWHQIQRYLKTLISYDFLVYPAVSTSSGSNKVPSNLQAVILVLCVLCPLPIHFEKPRFCKVFRPPSPFGEEISTFLSVKHGDHPSD